MISTVGQPAPSEQALRAGLQPRGWKTIDLGETCARVTTGKLDANAMKAGGAFPFFTCAREVYRINEYAFDGEALLVSGNGANVGYVHHFAGKFNAYQRTYVLIDFNVEVQFVRYFLEQNLAARISGEARYGNTPYITMDTLTKMEIVIPESSKEAQRISRALMDVDSLIGSLERLIAKKQAIKQGMMQQLLTGKTRLSGFTGDWAQKHLSELCDVRSGSPKKKYSEGVHWIVDMGSVTRDAKLVVTRKTDDQSGRLNPGELVMPKDDIGGGQIIGRTGLIPETGSYVLADHVYALTPRAVDPAFLNLAINSNPVNMELRSKVTGSAQLGLSRRSVLEQCILLPKSLDEQKKIAALFGDINCEEEALEQKLSKVRAVKQGMMQELLTGRTRLVPTEPAHE